MMPPTVRDAVILLGHMPEPEAVQFLTGRAGETSMTADQARPLWSASRAAIDGAPGFDRPPELRPMPKSSSAHLRQVEALPVFKEATLGKRWSFVEVEVDRLVCTQRYVDAPYAEESTRNGSPTNAASALNVCLPKDPVGRSLISQLDPIARVHTVYSENLDYRVLMPSSSVDPITKRRSIGFTVGWGAPFVMVTVVDGRYVLKNGYHRVFGLRQRGFTHVPCILLEGESAVESGLFRPGFFDQATVGSSRPPLFSHFFDNAVAVRLPLRAVTKVIRVRADEDLVPMTLNMAIPPGPATGGDTGAASEGVADEANLLGFRVEKEGWNGYRLSDGTTLFARPLLLSAETRPGAAPGELSFEASNIIMTLRVPPEMRGTPSPAALLPAEIQSRIVAPAIPFEVLFKTQNVYALTSGIKLSVEIKSLEVSRTSLFNAKGEPIYLLNHQLEIKVVDGPG